MGRDGKRVVGNLGGDHCSRLGLESQGVGVGEMSEERIPALAISRGSRLTQDGIISLAALEWGGPSAQLGAQAQIGQSALARVPAHGAGSADFIVICLECALGRCSPATPKARRCRRPFS